MAVEMVLAAAWSVAAARGGATAAAMVVVALAVVWEMVPVRRRIRRCRRTAPLAARGWRADAECARMGVRTGAGCVGGCWAVMAACAAFAHSLPVMVALFGVQWIGRRHPRWPPALAAAAVLVACLLPASIGHAARWLAPEQAGTHHHPAHEHGADAPSVSPGPR
jgi:predicted metal-binding membrane protein